MPADVLGARTKLSAYAEAYAATTEALVPIAVQRGAAALVAAATGALVVPTGKVFRLSGIYGSIVIVGTTPTTTRLRLRWSPAGTALAATSPIIGPNLRLGGNTAVAAHVYPFVLSFPEGIEFPAGATVGLTAAATNNTQHSLDVTLVGFDYNA